MRTRLLPRWLAIGLASALTIGGCARTGGSTTGSDASQPARADAPKDQRQATAAPARDACALISAKEVTEITGLAIVRVAKTSNGCEWYAEPGALQQAGTNSAAATFQQLNKQEPKTADEGVRAMQNILNGIRGAASPDKPLFAVIVDWDKGDEGEAVLRGTLTVVGGGLPGGQLEKIDGIGDRAFYGAMGTVFFARKGPAIVQFGLAIGGREQAIALAKKVVSKM